jgi:CDP-6-deoxy-D-xylo-4-hexulose-3-dehydrase
MGTVMKKSEALRDEILNKVNEYHAALKSEENKDFTPGKTRVNYAGRVFDEKEMFNLVDSSLEFWLTYGRYSAEFEKRLAEYLGVRYAFLVNSGSSANLLAFMTLTSPLLKERAVKRGDEVITVAAGFPTALFLFLLMLNLIHSILMLQNLTVHFLQKQKR